MKKVIVICGKANTGKTTVLEMFMKKYSKNIVKILYPVRRCGKNRNYIVVYKIKNKIVGVTANGDNRKLISEGYNILSKTKYKYDTIICTCHPSLINHTVETYKKDWVYVTSKKKAENKDNKKCLDVICRLL